MEIGRPASPGPDDKDGGVPNLDLFDLARPLETSRRRKGVKTRFERMMLRALKMNRPSTPPLPHNSLSVFDSAPVARGCPRNLFSFLFFVADPPRFGIRGLGPRDNMAGGLSGAGNRTAPCSGRLSPKDDGDVLIGSGRIPAHGRPVPGCVFACAFRGRRTCSSRSWK